MLANEDQRHAREQYGSSEAAEKQLSLEQQKAELKRKMMQKPLPRKKVKKLKRDTVYNPDSKYLSLKVTQMCW